MIWRPCLEMPPWRKWRTTWGSSQELFRDELNFSSGKFIHHYVYVTGVRTYPNGWTELYQDGKRVVR